MTPKTTANDPTMSTDKEPVIIDSIKDVISQLEFHRETHTQWAKHFEQHPNADAAQIGDDVFHREVERRYTRMIEVLESL